MADISQDLQAILDAIYGEEVRGSIYHAISLINDVSEVILTTGTDITAPTDSSEGYFNNSLYLNLDTYELWKCVGTNAWQSLGILKGATGENGNKWYRGSAVSGKAVLPTVYPTGIASANANDYYLNPIEGAIYHCVTGGDDTTATWSYDFTMTGGGGGSTVTWAQIQSSGTIIAEIDIDGTMQEVYAPEGGGMLPYLYIDSEAGATVTVNQPDGTTITPTAAGSGHWECELTGGYGTYVIHSVLSGQGDATLSLAVDTVKEYHVTDTHYDYTINVTAPSGSTVRITGGGETYTGTGTGTSQAFAVHTPSTTYTVAVTMDGNTKSETVTSAATSGQSGSVTIDFGTINVTVAADFVTAGSTITCVSGGTSCTPKTAASNLAFHVPTTGTWTISGEISGQTYSVDAVVTSLSTAVSVSLQTVPDGKTVTPTDDIQTWLRCAGVFNKTYTTLTEVLADNTTLLALISDNNAVDYLVRSTTWASDITANSTAMTDIGANDYCADILLDDGTWCSAICNSTYFESVLNSKVPTMTSNTAPSGAASADSIYGAGYEAYKVFDNNASTIWHSASGTTGYHWIRYMFDTTPTIYRVDIHSDAYSSLVNFVVRGSNDGSIWEDLTEAQTPTAQMSKYLVTKNLGAYKYYEVYIPTTSGIHIKALQFYGRES